MQFFCVFFHSCRKSEFFVSKGSVATCLRWGGFCSKFHTLFWPPAVQKLWKSVKIWQSYTEFKDRNFLRHNVLNVTFSFCIVPHVVTRSWAGSGQTYVTEGKVNHNSSSYLVGSKLDCLTTDAQWCEQLRQSCYAEFSTASRTATIQLKRYRYVTASILTTAWSRKNDMSETAEAQLPQRSRVDGHYVVQGHSRSPTVVTIESPYATSWLILTYILSRTVSKLLQIIGQICAFDRGYHSLTYLFGMNP